MRYRRRRDPISASVPHTGIDTAVPNRNPATTQLTRSIPPTSAVMAGSVVATTVASIAAKKITMSIDPKAQLEPARASSGATLLDISVQ